MSDCPKVQEVGKFTPRAATRPHPGQTPGQSGSRARFGTLKYELLFIDEIDDAVMLANEARTTAPSTTPSAQEARSGNRRTRSTCDPYKGGAGDFVTDRPNPPSSAPLT